MLSILFPALDSFSTGAGWVNIVQGTVEGIEMRMRRSQYDIEVDE
jgi:hypothetical protein